MILYMDTSALLKLYVDEEHSRWTRELVEELRHHVGVVATSAMTRVESTAAAARLYKRSKVIDEDKYRQVVRQLEADFRERYVVRPTDARLIDKAVAIADRHALRGYDATHLATSLVLSEQLGAAEEVLLLAFDNELHVASVAEGLGHVRPDREGGHRFGAVER